MGMALNNGSDTTVTVNTLLGAIAPLLGIEDLGMLGTRTISIKEGVIGLKVRIQGDLDLLDNDKNKILIKINEMDADGYDDALISMYYIGSEEAFFIDMSEIGFPKAKISGINLTNTLNGLIDGIKDTIINAINPPSEDIQEAVTRRVQRRHAMKRDRIQRLSTYKIVPLSTEESEAELDVMGLIFKVLGSIERGVDGKEIIDISLDNEFITTLAEGLGYGLATY